MPKLPNPFPPRFTRRPDVADILRAQAVDEGIRNRARKARFDAKSPSAAQILATATRLLGKPRKR